MLEPTALSMNSDESDDRLLISTYLIHFSGEEENEIKGKRKVIRRIHKPEGNWAESWGGKWFYEKEFICITLMILQIIISLMIDNFTSLIGMERHNRARQVKHEQTLDITNMSVAS